MLTGVGSPSRYVVAVSLLAVLSLHSTPHVHRSSDLNQHAGTHWVQRYEVAGAQGTGELACPTASDCLVLGSGYDWSSGGEDAVTTNGGLTWSRYPILRSTGGLEDVACDAASFCVADGGYTAAADITEDIFTSTNLGKTWRETSSLPESGIPGEFSCASRDLCFAVFDYGALYLSTDGTLSWSSPTLPVPDGYNATATSVSCPSPTSCFVIGSIVDEATAATSLVVWRWNGSGFVINLTGSGSGMQISCTSAGRCGATGTSGSMTVYLSTDDHGEFWTVNDLPSEITAPQAVTCIATTCTILSTDGDASSPLLADVTTDGGARWAQSTVLPRVRLSYQVGPTLACASAANCFVSGVDGGYVLKSQGPGARWKVLDVSAVGPPGLSAAACASEMDCVAVGGASILRSTNGGVSWTTTSDPTANSNLSAVVCPSRTICIADGAFGTGGFMLRSTDGGAVWYSVPLPVGSGPFLSAIACTTGWCVAIGPEGGLVISRNDGASWFERPFPSTWNHPLLLDLSCADGSCMAVGTDGSDGSLDITIDSRGSRWAENSFATFSQPVSVQCLSVSTCIADGTDFLTGPGSEVAGIYETTDGGISWSLLGQTDTGNPGLVRCASSVCHSVGDGYGSWPVFSALGTSNDGAATWSLDRTPSVAWQVSGLAFSGARWIAVGVNQLNGPEILTSP